MFYPQPNIKGVAGLRCWGKRSSCFALGRLRLHVLRWAAPWPKLLWLKKGHHKSNAPNTWSSALGYLGPSCQNCCQKQILGTKPLGSRLQVLRWTTVALFVPEQNSNFLWVLCGPPLVWQFFFSFTGFVPYKQFDCKLEGVIVKNWECKIIRFQMTNFQMAIDNILKHPANKNEQET